MRRVSAFVFAAVSALAPGRADATYSILAVDTRGGSVGGAVASCVDLDTVERVYGRVPGRGALMTQSYLKDGANAHGLMLIGEGKTPEEVMSGLLDPGYDADFELRQYAIVDVGGRVAAFTGGDAIPFASGATFTIDSYVVAVQGNVLTGASVIESARAAFETGGGCDLAERLMLAVDAAGSADQGDNRCTPSGVPAQSMTLDVDRPGEPAGSYLRLMHESPGDPPTEDPTVSIRAGFDAWRQTHPCPVDASGGGGSGGGTPGSQVPGTSEPPGSDGCTLSRRGPDGGPGRLVVLFLAGFLVCRRRR